MKEIKQITEAYQKIDLNKIKVALATVVRVEGSSYRRTGARMLVLESGEWIGGISGGCLEGDALKKARLAISQNKATLTTYDTTNEDPYQIGVGLGCNGIIDVLITPLDPENQNNAVRQLQNCISRRTPNLIITVTSTSQPNLELSLGEVFRFDNDAHFNDFFPINSLKESLKIDIKEALNSETSVSKEYVLENGAKLTLFLEIILPTLQLYIFGSNYDVYPMARMAKELGWQVICVCNPSKMHASLFELVDEVVPKNHKLSIDAFTAAVSMCHDYETDYQNLQQLLQTNIRYIGLLGPRKRASKMFERINEESNTPFFIQEPRIHSPIGLDIGAKTPEEIALSACAEIQAFFAERNSLPLKFRLQTIYE